MKFIVIICSFVHFAFGAWVMFNDGEDTYIYNNSNGDIYIRHNKGGKNYEDIFVKMPSGIIPKNIDENKTNTDKKVYNNDNNSNQELLNNLQKMQQDTFNKALE